MNLVDLVNKNYSNEAVAKFPDFRTGDTLEVHVKITEGGKSRIQLFEGICIALKSRNSINGHFRVRKISSGVGVERVFPFHSPNVVNIEIKSKGKARKSKLFYLRARSGKSARVSVDWDRQ